MMTRLQGAVTKVVATRRSASLTLAMAVMVSICGIGSTRSNAAPPVGPERSLVGIRIYSPSLTVLKKYGNPTDIITGADSASSSPNGGTTGGQPGMGPMPTPNSRNEFGGGGTTGGGSTTGGESNPQAVNEVTYRYVGKTGNKMDFLLSPDGRVIQITASGFHDINVKTARSITLGSSYLDVISKYGYPESQQNVNGIVTTKYTDRFHIAFQLFQNKVVSITVAAVE